MATDAWPDFREYIPTDVPSNSESESEFNSQTSIGPNACFEDIVGKSRALRKVLEQIEIVAPTTSTVLLHGDTGTGKELLARAIHNVSSRRNGAFVRMNCAAIPSGLLESELFGHERGAFTGALMQKKGRFEVADCGSLFLDEIGDISLELQPKLLRALQEQEFERLGSARTIKVDVRIIAATHRNLRDMIREGKFRDDLFYRLNVFPIHVPALRERKEDIPLLVQCFVSMFARTMGKTIRTIPESVMSALVRCPWHGNIRELKNFIERSVILSRGDTLTPPVAELEASSIPSLPEGDTLHHLERKIILGALRSSDGRIAGHGGAAEKLGLKRTTLQRKIQRLGIEKVEYVFHGQRQASLLN